jgi:hypothetical protein
MLALAHFYATALAVEPLFPDLGSSFCSALVLPPLEAIISVTNSMQSEQMMSPALLQIVNLMQFPQHTALSYRARTMQNQQLGMAQSTSLGSINQEMLGSASIGNLSPAFAPPSLHSSASQSSSATQSPYLEVPPTHQGFRYGTQGWGIPSPSFPAQNYQNQDEQTYGYMGNFRGGFVPASIWT